MAFLDVAVGLNVVMCSECGVDFGVPETYLQRRKEDGRAFYCPNGHSQLFRVSDVEKLKRQLHLREEELRQERARRETAERSARAHHGVATRAKGELLRIRQRVGAGVCPCCGRTFQQLARHMAAKHPNFTSERLPGDLSAVESEDAPPAQA